MLGSGGSVHEAGRPGADPHGLAEAARLANAVRLLQQGRIEARREAVDPILDVLRRSGVEVGGEPGLFVSGSGPLLRLCLLYTSDAADDLA